MADPQLVVLIYLHVNHKNVTLVTRCYRMFPRLKGSWQRHGVRPGVAGPSERSIARGSVGDLMMLKRRLTAGAIWSFVEAWTYRLCHLAVFVLLARLLAPADFGLASLAMVAVMLAQSLFVSGGCSEFLIQKRDIQPVDIGTVFWLQVSIAGVAMLLCIALAPIVGPALGYPDLVPLILWFAALLPLSALAAVPDALLRRSFAFRTLALRSTLAVVVGGACGIGFALSGFGVWSLVAFHLTHKVVEVAVLWCSQPLLPLRHTSSAVLREAVGFGAYSSASRLLQSIEQLIVRATASVIAGVSAVGYLHLGRSTLDEITHLLINPFSRVAMPAFAAIKADPQRLQTVLRLTTEASALIAFPCFLGLSVTASEWVPVVFGHHWTNAVGVVQILSLAGLTYPIGNLDVALLRGLGRVRLEAKLSFAATLLLVALMLPLAPFGAEGIAWAVLIRNLFVAPVRFAVVARYAAMDRRGEVIAAARLFLLAVVMAAVVVAWQRIAAPDLTDPVRLAATVGVGVATYTTLLAIFARRPLTQLWRIVRSRQSGEVTEPAPAVPPVASDR